MIDWIRREAIYLWYYLDIQVRQIAPYWALGILLGSAVSVFGKRYIHGAFSKIGQRRTGWLGVIPASLLGVASPLCMYGTIPIAASFSEQGVKDDTLAAFMMSSILLNPQLILYSGALGRTAVVIRCLSCAFCGCVAGWLIRLFYSGRGRTFFDFTGFHEGASRDTDPNLFLRFLKNVWRNIRATGPMWLETSLQFCAGHPADGALPDPRPRRIRQRIVREERGLRRADGGHHRRAAVHVRRGNDTAASTVAGGRHEHGQRRGVHDHRAARRSNL